MPARLRRRSSARPERLDLPRQRLSFTITASAAGGTHTFTYTAAAPNPQQGQFNTLTNLATSINDVAGLSARIVNNQLYVASTDSNEQVTFANGSTAGASGPPVQGGIDWINELGLKDIPSSTTQAANLGVASLDRFSSLNSLAADINAASGLTAKVNNPTGQASLSINLDDPLGTITFTDGTIGSPNNGSVLSA